MSYTFISYREGDADYTTHTLHPLTGASQSGQTQVVEVLTVNGVTYAMLIDASTSATNGLSGWTPTLSLFVDGDRTLVRVSDWVGGTGAKPSTGMFLGTTGFVADPAQAISVRGPKGDAGDIAQLADGSIGKTKLSPSVQDSLGKADSAIRDLAGVVTAVANGPADKRAELQGLVSGVKNLGNVGTRMFCGRTGSFLTSASGTTFHVLAALAAKFDAVRVILANSSTSSALTVDRTIVSAIAAMATDSNINNSGATWGGITFGGSASVTIPAAPGTSRKAYAVSDWYYNLQSKDRTDGGTLPLLGMRAYVSAASATITTLGLSSASVTNWRSHPSGRVWVMRKHDGDAANTPANLSSTTDINQTIIAGVQYLARGKVITVMAQGDSIQEGQGTYLNEGYALPACLAVQTSIGIPVELAQCAVSGSTGDTFVYRTEDLIAAGIVPDVLIQAIASPNGYTTAFSTSQRDTARAMLPRLLQQMKAARVRIALGTFTPNDTKLWGADDANRIALNADVAAWPGLTVYDASAVTSGVVDGTGKTLLKSGVSSDGLHPNDAGNALIADVCATAIKDVLWTT